MSLFPREDRDVTSRAMGAHSPSADLSTADPIRIIDARRVLAISAPASAKRTGSHSLI